MLNSVNKMNTTIKRREYLNNLATIAKEIQMSQELLKELRSEVYFKEYLKPLKVILLIIY